LWPDRLALAIYPGRLVWLLAGGMGKRVLQKGETAFEAGNPDALQQACGTLLDGIGKRVRIHAVISNRLVRYALVPNPDNARNVAERARLAAHVFERTHGDAADSWHIALSHSAIGKNALAAAVDKGLVRALNEAAGARGCRIHTLQPYLMAAFNASRRNHAARSGVFAVAEPGRLCIASWKDRGWACVQQSHLDAANPEWRSVLARVSHLSGFEGETPGWLYAAETPRSVEQSPLKALPVRWTVGLMPDRDTAWGGVMLGLG
jgi:hypothetical protein